MEEKIIKEITEFPSKKQIAFDLNDKKLKNFYPRPKLTLNPSYHKKAWKDIARFMKKNGFEHRQYSVYASHSEMTSAQVNALTRTMVMRMPWLYKCLNAIDVTNIGEQHSLMPIVKGVGIVLEQEEKTAEKEEVAKENPKGDTMSDWKGRIEKEKADNPVGQGKSKSRTQKDRIDAKLRI